MDPVQKAVINHTFGVPNPLKKKQFISCNICHLRFNSAVSCALEGVWGDVWVGKVGNRVLCRPALFIRISGVCMEVRYGADFEVSFIDQF